MRKSEEDRANGGGELLMRRRWVNLFCLSIFTLIQLQQFLLCFSKVVPLQPNSNTDAQEKADEEEEEAASRLRQQEVDATAYLQRYGYIEGGEARNKDGGGGGREEGIRLFQEMANLPGTGKMDARTAQMMEKPRCGTEDVPRHRPDINITITISRSSSSNSNRRPDGDRLRKWQKTILTYRIDRFPRFVDHVTVDRNRVRSILKRAIDLWTSVSPLTLTPINEPTTKQQQQQRRQQLQQPDISIAFFAGYHDDEHPFDGPGKTLAHAFPPGDGIGGDIHFDEDENWSQNSAKDGVDLLVVAAHEIGHALGVNHSHVPDALMFPWYQEFNGKLQLHQDDIEAIQSLYGERREKVRNSVDHEAAKGSQPNPCAADFDAIAAIRGELFIFKDKWFWRRDSTWRMTQKPTLISRFWTGLPADFDRIDAAYERPRDNRIILFSGRRYFEFDELRLLTRNGRPLTDLGLPGDLTQIDAILLDAHRTHYISGRRHWTMDSNGRQLSSDNDITSSSSSSSAAAASHFPLLSSSIKNTSTSGLLSLPFRTAFTHSNGDIYVFKDDLYVRLKATSERGKGDGEGEERPFERHRTRRLWSDCSSIASTSFHVNIAYTVAAAAAAAAALTAFDIR